MRSPAHSNFIFGTIMDSDANLQAETRIFWTSKAIRIAPSVPGVVQARAAMNMANELNGLCHAAVPSKRWACGDLSKNAVIAFRIRSGSCMEFV